MGELVTVPGTPRLAVELAGDGPLLFFLHGIGGNRTNWREQLHHFAAAGWRCAAWDARGYGDSEDYEGALDFADFSADLIRALDHLGAERVVLCGLSMGGRIAIDFFARHPERVKAIVLADTSAGAKENQAPEKVEEFLRLRKKPLVEDGLTPRDIAPNLVQTLIGPNATDAQRARLEESIAALHKDSYIKTMDCVTRYTAFPAYGDLKTPLLVISGTEDRIATPAISRAIADGAPDAELVLLEGAGHLSNIEQPEAFNAAVEDFLERRAR